MILMRHGKSAYPDGVADHERPLAPRGLREAGLAGQWLREVVAPIDTIRCSTALRTRQTLEATGLSAPVEFDADIYEGTPASLIELIQLTDDTVETLLIVGHAPGMPWTSWELASNRDSTQATELSRKFPTSALAVLEFDRPWAEIDHGTGELVHFHVAR
ncbi:histidine phosphatase family protein [Nocardia callitridis]|uniref:Histidine phosphatase family protein n=1 Tax=Nocardia callitridis TaxID=648753 RepID=A0ABP9JU30_9NOCA